MPYDEQEEWLAHKRDGDVAANYAFAETLEWLARMIETEQFGEVTPASLRARASGIYDMLRDERAEEEGD